MTGPGLLTMFNTILNVSVHPQAFLTVSETVSFELAVVNVCTGSGRTEYPPSPKFHSHEVMGDNGSNVDMSVNDTELFRQALISLALKAACGPLITRKHSELVPEQLPAESVSVILTVVPGVGHITSILSP